MAPSSTQETNRGDDAEPVIPRLDKLQQQLQDLVWHLERMHMAEYIALFQNPRRLVWLNFLSGIARGLGIAVGFALLSAVVVYILQRLTMLNLPLVGNFIAQLVHIVQMRMTTMPGP